MFSNNDSEGAKWLQKAAESGYDEAQAELARFYDLGIGVQRDEVEANKWRRKAADQGLPWAQWSLGLNYEKGRGIDQNFEKAASWYLKAAENGYETAQVSIGDFYRNGTGVPKDNVQATKWYSIAAENGDTDGQVKLGEMYEKGEGIEIDVQKAMFWYQKAAEEPNGFGYEGAVKLGWIYYYGKGTNKDVSRAISWWRKAAESHYCTNSKNILRICETLSELESGDPKAKYKLGFDFLYGGWFEEDKQYAMQLIREAANDGDADAQLFIGDMYRDGEGIPQDDAEAVKWYRKAAEQGHALAQYNLGVMYFDGNGGQEDDAEAVRWYRKAAEQGHALAQFNLGNMYRKGTGVPEDDAEAVRWYRKAAEQGHALAQVSLGIMYAFGQGVIPSGAAAADWYYKAGISYLKDGDRENALTCVERIKYLTSVLKLTVPNSFLADKLLTRVYGKGSEQPTPQSEREQAENTVSGTGWPVAGGFVVTNHHVVVGHDNIVLLRRDGEQIRATVAVYDAVNDLALLKPESSNFLPPALPLADRSAQVGEQVFTVGYPHPDMMGVEAKLTQGIVNARTGLMSDPRMYQISVPMQAGNSGGPLLNMNGEVVGVVMAKMSAVKVFEWTGDLPQNVNYAVKAGYVRVLLSSVDPTANLAVLPAKKDNLTSLADRVVGSVLMVVAQ